MEAADSSPPDRHLQSEQQRKGRMGQYGRGHLARSTHLPATSILPLAEGSFLKSKITEVYANDPEVSREHLILLPRVSQKGRKAFALF